jgi:hypothetical protein
VKERAEKPITTVRAQQRTLIFLYQQPHTSNTLQQILNRLPKPGVALSLYDLWHHGHLTPHCLCQIQANTPQTSNTKMAQLIIALEPNLFRSASIRFLNPFASFARRKGVSFGTFLPRNSRSGAHPSSIFHSSSRSVGTRLRIMAAYLAWVVFPSFTPARSDRYEGNLNRQGHRTCWCTCHIHHKSD